MEPKSDFKCLECGVCLELLCRPSSTPCGHNFCKNCLDSLRGCSFSNLKCPICRSSLPKCKFKVNILLETLIKDLFPKEYSERLHSFSIRENRSRMQVFLTVSFKTFKTLFLVMFPAFALILLAENYRKLPGASSRLIKTLVRLANSGSGSYMWQVAWTLAHVIVRYIEATSVLSGIANT